jgi:hypothetical protein
MTHAVAPLSALAASPADPPVLFDPRFSAARRYAVEWAGPGAVQALQDDVSDLVLSLWAPHPQRRTALRGVTTESVPFCLRELAPRATRPTVTQRRLDRDLFAWTWVLQV